MTPEQFRTIRINAGLSVNELADVLRISDGRSIRRYEDGSRAISGPIALHMERIANPQQGASWQPIETAPKDGTAIWIGEPYTGHGTGRMEPVRPAKEGFGSPWSWTNIYTGYAAQWHPTHWSTLPEPPQ